MQASSQSCGAAIVLGETWALVSKARRAFPSLCHLSVTHSLLFIICCLMLGGLTEGTQTLVDTWGPSLLISVPLCSSHQTPPEVRGSDGHWWGDREVGSQELVLEEGLLGDPKSLPCAPVSQWMALCCCLVAKFCLTLQDPMDCSTPGFPILHCLLEFAQVDVH